MQDLRAYVDQQLALALDRTFSQQPGLNQRFVEALGYVLLAPGKRFRGQLVLHAAVCSALSSGLTEQAAMQQVIARATPAALAVEAIHAYSLVHDDLPCMDNDDLRRGRPTCHVQYGEAMALLVGDALQAMAFAWLADPFQDLSPRHVQLQMQALALAAGPLGMVGGQVQDCESVGHSLTEEALLSMHQRKTGALLEASLALGVLAVTPAENLDPRLRGDDGVLRGDDGVLRGEKRHSRESGNPGDDGVLRGEKRHSRESGNPGVEVLRGDDGVLRGEKRHSRESGNPGDDGVLRGEKRHSRESGNPGVDGVLAHALVQLGQIIGLVYQIQDDILDVCADAGQLGKTAGKDALHDKPTAVTVWGLAEAQARLQAWQAELQQTLVDIRQAMPDGSAADAAWSGLSTLIHAILRRTS